MRTKHLTLLFLSVLCVWILCACGAKKEITPGTDETSAVESVSPSPTATPESTPEPPPEPTPTPEPTPEPTPAPEATPEPTPTPEEGLPVLSKSPTDETVNEGGGCYFVAKCDDVISVSWHFVSPDGTEDLDFEKASERFPTMYIMGGMYATLQLGNIPEAISGWRVYCRFSNDVGYVDTDKALLTVIGSGKPAPTPVPMPESVPASTASPTDPQPALEETDPQPTVGPVINDWLTTDDLDTAIIGSGIEFKSPVQAALPGNKMTLTFYRYRTGILEACYGDEEGNGLLIRKSTTLSGDELSGDYNTYSSAWDQSVKNNVIHCKGDGKTINNATFGADENWAVLYNIGQEGKGMASDQLNALILSMK